MRVFRNQLRTTQLTLTERAVASTTLIERWRCSRLCFRSIRLVHETHYCLRDECEKVNELVNCRNEVSAGNHYFLIVKDTTFVVFLPFFGVTVTVTLHVPVLRPFRVFPTTLHTVLELLDETIETVAPVGTVIP